MENNDEFEIQIFEFLFEKCSILFNDNKFILLTM